MVFTTHYLEDVERAVHILKGLAEVATSVVVQCQVQVAVSTLGVILSEQSLLQDDALGLKFNCLQEVAKLKLNTGKF